MPLSPILYAHSEDNIINLFPFVYFLICSSNSISSMLALRQYIHILKIAQKAHENSRSGDTECLRYDILCADVMVSCVLTSKSEWKN